MNDTDLARAKQILAEAEAEARDNAAIDIAIQNAKANILTPGTNPPAVKPTFQERTEEVAAAVHVEPNLVGVDQLIAEARKRLGTMAASDDTPTRVEVSDAAAANELLAQRDSLKRQASILEEAIEKIDNIFVDLIGDNEELTVGGAVVFTYKNGTSRVLNQAQIKKLFPDIPENAEFWKDQPSRKKNWK